MHKLAKFTLSSSDAALGGFKRNFIGSAGSALLFSESGLPDELDHEGVAMTGLDGDVESFL